VSTVRKPVPLVKVGEEAAGGEPVVVAGFGTDDVFIFLWSFANIVRYPPIRSYKFGEEGPFSFFLCFNLVLRKIHTLLE